MGYNKTICSRRQFLGTSAGLSTAVVAGCTSPLSAFNQELVRTAQGKMTVPSDAKGLTDDERSAYIQEMDERYGSWAAKRIIPIDSHLSKTLQPGVKLTSLVWDGEQSLAVTDSSGETIAESDNYVGIYETEEPTSPTGQSFAHWLWVCANPRDVAVLREVWSHVNLRENGELMAYEPGGDRSNNGTIGPHPDLTGQDADEFAVRWQGNHGRAQNVTGSLIDRRSEGNHPTFEWTVHLEAESR